MNPINDITNQYFRRWLWGWDPVSFSLHTYKTRGKTVARINLPHQLAIISTPQWCIHHVHVESSNKFKKNRVISILVYNIWENQVSPECMHKKAEVVYIDIYIYLSSDEAQGKQKKVHTTE